MKIEKVIQDYEAFIEELQHKQQFKSSPQEPSENMDFFSKFNSQPEIQLSLEEEKKSIQELVVSLTKKLKIQEKIHSAKNRNLVDHYAIPIHKLSPIHHQSTNPNQVTSFWKKYLRINHQICISIRIHQLIPCTSSNSEISREINLQKFSFHLHHVDQHFKSSQVCYNAKYNIFQSKHIINNSMYAENREIQLQIKHQIRKQNLPFLTKIFTESKMLVVVESESKIILGFAEINLEEQGTFENNNNEFKCLFFSPLQMEEGNYILNDSPLFLAKTTIEIQANPIAPEISQLQDHLKLELKSRLNEKSKSKSKIYSNSPSRSRSSSPISKKYAIKSLLKPDNACLKIFTIDKYELNIELSNLNPLQQKPVITYLKQQNIEFKSIEIVQIENIYYIKTYFKRESTKQNGMLKILLQDHTQYQFIIGSINKFRIISLLELNKIRENYHSNIIIEVCPNVHVYHHQSTKIIKNQIRQTFTNGFLTSIYLKSKIQDASIFTTHECSIQHINHDDNGYLIHFYYHLPQNNNTNTKINLSFSFINKGTILHNEIHIFDCSIQPRLAIKDSLSKQLQVSNAQHYQIYKVSMTLITSENMEYNIRTCQQNVVNIVNGKRFKYHHIFNPYLILQVLVPINVSKSVEIILDDQKYRSVLMKVQLIQVSELAPFDMQEKL